MENHLWEQTVRAGEKKWEKSHKTDEDKRLKEDP